MIGDAAGRIQPATVSVEYNTQWPEWDWHKGESFVFGETDE